MIRSHTVTSIETLPAIGTGSSEMEGMNINIHWGLADKHGPRRKLVVVRASEKLDMGSRMPWRSTCEFAKWVIDLYMLTSQCNESVMSNCSSMGEDCECRISSISYNKMCRKEDKTTPARGFIPLMWMWANCIKSRWSVVSTPAVQ